MPSQTLDWLSTTLAGGPDLGRLTVKTIGELTTTASQITVAAAYWDVGFLGRLLTAIPAARRSKVVVDVYLNGFTGQRAADDASTLQALTTSWRKRGLRRLSFNMVGGWQLFHTKVLVFERAKGVSLLVGSANATEAAFSENEELMLMLRAPNVPKGLRRYLAAVKEIAVPIGAITPFEARTLTSFFRGGDVYYRPTIVTSFRFDLRLPAAMRQAMARLQIPIPGITARAGQSYNPFAQVGLTLEEELQLEEATAPDEGPGAIKETRVPLRSFGVQTCYGWWVPTAYRDKLETKLKPARKKRAKLLNRLAHLLAHKGETLREQAAARFGQLQDFASDRAFPLTESPDHRLERFDEFLGRTRKRLGDPRWRRRAEDPYIQASVPEMWSDPTSAGEFTDSVFDYLEFVAATTRKRPIVWRSLVERVPSLEEASSSEEIRNSLVTYLAQEGWAADDWMEATVDAP